MLQPRLIFGSCRRIGTIIVRATYGHYITDENDPFLTVPLTAMENFSQATAPGVWAVDLLPMCESVVSQNNCLARDATSEISTDMDAGDCTSPNCKAMAKNRDGGNLEPVSVVQEKSGAVFADQPSVESVNDRPAYRRRERCSFPIFVPIPSKLWTGNCLKSRKTDLVGPHLLYWVADWILQVLYIGLHIY